MKQKVAQRKTLFKWKRKLPIILLVVYCFGSVFMMLSRYGRVMMLSSLRPQSVPGSKIAFLFIARNRLLLDSLGYIFSVSIHFLQQGENKFSIFVHSRPGFLFNKATTRSIYFMNRQVNDGIQVEWGEASMIEAELILLRHALTDTSNQRFIFLSDSYIPLYNFSYTYDYVMSTSTSFVDSFADSKEERYNPKMDPVIPVQNWRKGSQWVVLTRKHAEGVVKDSTVFPMFQQHFKREITARVLAGSPISNFQRWCTYVSKLLLCNCSLRMDHGSKEHNCIPDEHYVQTLLAQKGYEELKRRSLTYFAWDLSYSKGHERRNWHPVTYKFSDATIDLIPSIKGIDNIYYETEYQREMVHQQGKTIHRCFLFARKFTRPAALRLLNMSALGMKPH